MGTKVFAQTNSSSSINDLVVWNNLGYELTITNKITLGIAEQIRIHESFSKMDQFFTNVNLDYELSEHFKLSGNYRFLGVNTSSYIDWQQRWSIDGIYQFEWQSITPSFRLRYQSKNSINPTPPYLWENHFRMRGKIDFNLKNTSIAPFVTTEIWHSAIRYSSNKFDRIRYTLGLNWQPQKKDRIEIFTGFEHRLNTIIPARTLLLGVSYQFRRNLKGSKSEVNKLPKNS